MCSVLAPSDYASADVEDAQYRAAHLTMTTSYVCFTGDLAEEGNVSLTIAREDTQETVYARDYGSVLGPFRTEDIYLRLDIQREADLSRAAFRRQWRPQLSHPPCDAPLGGQRCLFRRLSPSPSGTARACRQSATLLDVAAMEGTSCTYDLIASNRYLLGTVTFTVSNNAISTRRRPFTRGGSRDHQRHRLRSLDRA